MELERSEDTAFELKDVCYTYPEGIHGVEVARLEIARGGCTVLLGPNGSGKSTLLKILDGLVFPQRGEVMVFGGPLSEGRLRDAEFRGDFRSRVGLVFQDADIQCFSPTVYEELAFGPMQGGLSDMEIERRVGDAAALLGIESIEGRYPFRLSGGEKKRVAIASVLTVDPEVLLLDEPTANLDPATEGVLIDLLADLTRRGKTLVVATQDLLLARHVGQLAIVLGPDRRLISCGAADEILGDEALLERAGLLHRHRHPHGRAAAGSKHAHYTVEDRE